MKLLLKNAQIVNGFTDRLEEANILIDGEKIIGVGQYKDEDADTVGGSTKANEIYYFERIV